MVRDKDTWWPFPITPSLRRMEQKMLERLALPRGAEVLDAGCGIGHVALYMARQGGLRVTALDVVAHHAAQATRNVAHAQTEAGWPTNGAAVTVARADYHHLDWIPAASLAGVYTMETLVHATDLDQVLRGFFRVLTPGGRFVGHEYETRVRRAEETGGLAGDVAFVVTASAMPLAPMRPGNLKRTLEAVGFVDVDVQDYSENVRPMLRLFYWLAIVPYYLILLLPAGWRRHFINTVAGVGGLTGQTHWKYISIRATKPGDLVESFKTK